MFSCSIIQSLIPFPEETASGMGPDNDKYVHWSFRGSSRRGFIPVNAVATTKAARHDHCHDRLPDCSDSGTLYRIMH